MRNCIFSGAERELHAALRRGEPEAFEAIAPVGPSSEAGEAAHHVVGVVSFLHVV